MIIGQVCIPPPPADRPEMEAFDVQTLAWGETLMAGQSKWRNHFQENKTLFIILAVGLFLVELEIFAMAAMKSGRESQVHVLDHQNNLVYEARSSRLDPREKAEFENTFGPLSDYQVKLVTVQRPFPFRAWFAAAVGLPIGAVLLFGFFIKAYEALFFKNEPYSDTPSGPRDLSTDRLDRLIGRVSRLNIFAIGGFVLLFALGLFAVPHLLSEFGRHGVAIISKYRWVAFGLGGVFLGLVIWIIFLRYLLARKSIEAQADVEKYRLQLELMSRQEQTPQLAAPDRPQLELPRNSPNDLDAKSKSDRSVS
jgi:hypothetical protein